MYQEVNVLGVYLAPIVLMMLLAWIITLPIHHVSNRFGLTRRVWHRGLFNLCIYISVLSITIVSFGVA
ncbi:DUF1656 domain-containing protein [Aliirhizobium cellulosilyticum]|uniref:DUF1656 domain-containing protein n=1 Tax=Aliirhizobium cellulosilyticum TaxID=393664 RepID=A0A7W6UZ60_9HYPH|nr:DUF1656 domain-containing protein [Rhizobium cellulosilyticum]MBB4349380.1 hypothetical protein [Rhizobium cellulosilyticum]MBB4412398.1 hypothetical protein [Rhizobium cellulosilyticum]MBB4447030.1 hypothetical protein [Rhizobium cellulosilyticum]